MYIVYKFRVRRTSSPFNYIGVTYKCAAHEWSHAIRICGMDGFRMLPNPSLHFSQVLALNRREQPLLTKDNARDSQTGNLVKRASIPKGFSVRPRINSRSFIQSLLRDRPSSETMLRFTASFFNDVPMDRETWPVDCHPARTVAARIRSCTAIPPHRPQRQQREGDSSHRSAPTPAATV